MRLYDSKLSGNAYKVRLLLSHLGLPYERVEIDVIHRQNRVQQLGDKSAIAKIPILELDDGRHLAESGAILWYLGRGTPYVPEDPLEQARVLGWMFFEQNNHEPNLATSHYWIAIAKNADEHAAELAVRHAAGRAALAAMERHLEREPFFGGGAYSIADIALYPYTRSAPKARFDLGEYPAVGEWLGRVESQPRYVRENGSPR